MENNSKKTLVLILYRKRLNQGLSANEQSILVHVVSTFILANKRRYYKDNRRFQDKQDKTTSKVYKCWVCEVNHSFMQCDVFWKMNIQERKETVRKYKL